VVAKILSRMQLGVGAERAVGGLSNGRSMQAGTAVVGEILIRACCVKNERRGIGAVFLRVQSERCNLPRKLCKDSTTDRNVGLAGRCQTRRAAPRRWAVGKLTRQTATEVIFCAGAFVRDEPVVSVNSVVPRQGLFESEVASCLEETNPGRLRL